MPKTKAEKKTLADFEKEYGKKRGRNVYFATRQKNPKFDRSQGGGFSAKAQWILDRLNKLPEANKLEFIKSLLKANSSTNYVKKSGAKFIYAVKKVHPQSEMDETPIILVAYDSMDEAKAACMDSYANPTNSMSADLDSFRAD